MYYIVSNDYLAHHGVKGQKWGVRRYQNPDGTLTPQGRKRLFGNKEITLQKGSIFNRVSQKGESDVSSDTDKLYVTADEKDKAMYEALIGSTNLIKSGKAFCHEYLAEEDIRIPSVKLQNKISLDMLKDKEIRQELQDSFMKKGYTRERAAEMVESVHAGKIAATSILAGAGMGALQGAAFILPAFAAGNPVVGAVVTGSGAAAGAGIGAAMAIQGVKIAKENKARIVANALGDKANVKLNSAYSKALRDKGYNAYRDYNDKTNGMQSDAAIILDKPGKSVYLKSAKEMSRSDYARSFAKYKWNKLTKQQKREISYESLIKDGEANYDKSIEQYKVNKYKKKEKEKALAAS